MSEDIWAGDHLNRKEDAEFLIEYLRERNARAVAAKRRGVSINVSAPWGTGKTFFMYRLAQQLRAKGMRVAEVDAWRDDHADDPIFPVMSAVLKALNKTGKKVEIREALKRNAGKIAIRAGIGLAKRGAAIVIGQDAVDGIADDVGKAAVDAAEQTLSEYAERALERFEDGQKAIDDFRSEVAKAVEDGEPLFVLIDEVDRCRPTYAISLLERIKHLFDVPNVVFLVATHTDQLAHTIRAVYGAGFDADTYLHRFFDQTYSFDEPALGEFVEARWDAVGLDNKRFTPVDDRTPASLLAEASRVMQLSLRDIGQCMEALRYVVQSLDQRVPVPILYVFPLIAAYHLRRMAAFNIAAGVPARNANDQGASTEYQLTFGKVPLFEHKRHTVMGQYINTENVELRSIVDGFRQLFGAGLASVPQDDGSWVGRYVEDYRRREFHILHGNIAREPKPRVMLEDCRLLIQKAGRIGQPKKSDPA